MTTYQTVADRTDTQIPDHLIAQAEIPTTTAGRQGDVIIIPTRLTPKSEGRPLTGTGIKVVQGDADRNSHILNGDGTWHPGIHADRDLDYGLLTVPAGGEAVLTHTGEHGSIAFPEGTYRVFGQLDHQAQRRVAD